MPLKQSANYKQNFYMRTNVWMQIQHELSSLDVSPVLQSPA